MEHSLTSTSVFTTTAPPSQESPASSKQQQCCRFGNANDNFTRAAVYRVTVTQQNKFVAGPKPADGVNRDSGYADSRRGARQIRQHIERNLPYEYRMIVCTEVFQSYARAPADLYYPGSGVYVSSDVFWRVNWTYFFILVSGM